MQVSDTVSYHMREAVTRRKCGRGRHSMDSSAFVRSFNFEGGDTREKWLLWLTFPEMSASAAIACAHDPIKGFLRLHSVWLISNTVEFRHIVFF